jgi:hypothetical protein
MCLFRPVTSCTRIQTLHTYVCAFSGDIKKKFLKKIGIGSKKKILLAMARVRPPVEVVTLSGGGVPEHDVVVLCSAGYC